MSQFVSALNCVVTTFLMELDGVLIAVMPTFRRVGGGINIFNLTTFNTAIDAQFVTSFMPHLSSDITYRLTQSRRQNVVSDIAASTAVNDGEVGEEGVALPSGCCFRVEVRTDTPGRGARGAIYMPGVPRTKVTLNTIDFTWASQIEEAWGEVDGAAQDAGWEMVVRSKFVGNTPRPTALITPVQWFTHADLVVDYQRRRKPDPGISDGDFFDEQFFLP